MYKLKAFCQIAALVDNTVDVVAPIGELSDRGFTYAKNKERLTSSASPGYTLFGFSSKRDNKVEQVDGVLAQNLLAVCKWAYDQAVIPKFNSSTESFRTLFIEQWGDKYSIYSIGQMTLAGGGAWMPAYIELHDGKDDTLQYKIWFASTIFEQQYDEYVIDVVSPVEELDVFFEGRQAVKIALDEFTHDIKMEKVQALRDIYSETYISGPMYEWYDPAAPKDPAMRIPAYFTALIYGIAGNNVDAIKEAIQEHILANSTHPKADWEKVFPEIFTATEFIFVPFWNKYAVPNRVLETGIYASYFNLNYAKAEVTRLVRGEGYTDEYISGNVQGLVANHRAISLGVVGGPRNRDGIVEFGMRYPDYICVDPLSTDFMRMSPTTRRLAGILAEILPVAEAVTPDSSIPVKFSRMTRDGVLYVTYNLDRFQIVVATKYSAEDKTLSGNSQDEPSL